jgi:hypothetical protein
MAFKESLSLLIELDGADDAAQDVETLGDGVDDMGKKLKTATDRAESLGSGLSNAGDRARRGGAGVKEYSGHLDRAGDSADNAERSFTGLASGVDGVTTLMADPSPQEMAQGIADLADGAGNFLVPALKKAKDSVMGFVGGLRSAEGGLSNLGKAATVGGIVAVGAALATVADQVNKQNIAEQLDEMAAQFVATGVVTDEMIASQWRAVGVMSQLIDASPTAAAAFVDLAEAQGLDAEMADKMRRGLADTVTAQEAAGVAAGDTTAAVNDQSDALLRLADVNAGLFDPIFAAVSANRALEDANRAVVEAVDAHGTSSREYEDAQWAALTATVAQESAIAKLAGQVKRGEINMDQATRRLREMGGGSQNTAALVDLLEGEVYGLRQQIGGLQDRTVHIDVVYRRTNAELLSGYSAPGRASGGPVGRGWAGWVGEEGREWLEMGNMTGHVYTEDQLRSAGSTRAPVSAARYVGSPAVGAAAAAPTVVRIDLSGGDNELMTWLRRRIKHDGGGNVQAALGQ